MSAEDDRATEYRRMMTARYQNKLARERALAGRADLAQALREKWEPLRLWMAEQRDQT